MTLRVALEIGHGHRIVKGRAIFDPGAVGVAGVSEHTVCLRIGQIAQELLSTFIEQPIVADLLVEPVTLTGRGEAGKLYDAFVSLHLNASTLKKAQGTEVFILPEHLPADKILATKLQNALVEKLGLADRGVKQMKLAVLLGATGCPARCLVESFFIDSCTSREEIYALANRAGVAVATGIIHYFFGSEQLHIKKG